MKPETEVKSRVASVFCLRSLNEMAKATGYPRSTLSQWRSKPESIRAVDLIRLEQIVGGNNEKEAGMLRNRRQER